MKTFNKLMKVKAFKIWFIVSLVLIVLTITVNLVATQSTFIRNTLNIVLGGPERVLVQGDPEGNQYFESDYESKDATIEAANDFNEHLNEEGIVLLKNDGDVLPLDGRNISVFGKSSVNLVYGGSGSGGGDFENAPTLYDSLDDAGFNVNPTLKSFYESDDSGDGRPANPRIEGGMLYGFATGETPMDDYTQTVRDSYDDYDDAALVVISRIGGEGFDLPRTMESRSGDPIDGAASGDDHYLELDQNEQDLLQEVGEQFNQVILIINAGTSFELGFLDEVADNDATQNDYDYADNIQAALWIGAPGYSGIMALGRVLDGTVNPSGHTVNTYVRDFSQDPTWLNFANNFSADGNQYMYDGDPQLYFFVDYEEGIYVGYRYYETRGFTDGESWYDDHVVYPMGHGLSYTSFDWEVVDSTPGDGGEIAKDDVLSVDVRVTNTGDVAGKDVVQLYVTPPYTAGGIEKSHVTLVGFEKTATILPGESDTVTVEFTPYDTASYDFADKNDNGFEGYEVEEGNYVIRVSQDAHHSAETIHYTVPDGGFLYDEDPDTEYPVENRFDEVSEGLTSTLSRNDWDGTWPTTPTLEDRTIDAALLDALEEKEAGTPEASTIPDQRSTPIAESEAEVKLYELIDKAYDDPLWQPLLDQLTFDQIRELVGHAAFQTIGIEEIGLPRTVDADGPYGFVNFMGDPTINNTVSYGAPILVASTWNKDLAEDLGEMVGNEGIWGNQAGDGVPYTGWYAPAFNIHRTPFSGRNNEYYSEDSFLSGEIAASVIKGAESKGLITFVKHFVLNDQETRRDINGLVTWADEQSMREIYFKPFEMAVKDGGTTGIMTSFNRLGTEWAGGDYDLLTEVLRNEWGFRGAVITDFNLQPYMDTTQMVLAGGDLNLSQSKPPSDDYSDPTYATALRGAAHNILYAVANSNAMNGYGEDVIYRLALPQWIKIMFVVDGAIAVGLGTWGYFTIKKSLGQSG